MLQKNVNILNNLLAVCLKMVITIHVMPAYSPIIRIPAKWKMSLES